MALVRAHGRHRESAAVIGALVVFALTIAAALSAATGLAPDHSASISGRPPSVASAAPTTATHSPVALAPLLASHGYTLPEGVSVYAAELVKADKADLRRVEYAAGDGAFGDTFWPASSIKVVVALGALDFLHSLGFTGAATITSDDGWTQTARDLADAAIQDSSNDAYDMLVQIAGFDRLNTSFLSAANGFPSTVVQRSYSGIDIRSSPEMTVAEDGRTQTVPARTTTNQYDCPDDGNCSSLFEMAESVERVVLDSELPAAQRLDLDPADIRALTGDLQATQTFVEPGVKRALGNNAVVYGKPGWVSDEDCVDVGTIEDVGTGRTYLLGVSSPDAGPGCDVLSDVAEQVLRVVEADSPRE